MTNSPPLHCEILTRFERLEELAPTWQYWAESDPQAEVFQCWSWAHAFWTAYGGSLCLCTPVVRQGERVVGILPLVRKGETLQFLGSPESDYNDVLCAQSDAASVLETALEALLKLPGTWRTCVLDNLPVGSRIAQHWQELPLRLRKHFQPAYRYPSATIMLTQDKEVLLARLMNIKDLRLHHKKLQKLGNVTFRHIENRNEAREHLHHFFDQHIARFALNGLQSQFLQPEQRAFYTGLIQEMDPCTELRFAVLELDGRPVAYHLGFQLHGKFVHYKPTFDVDYWDCSPGDVLLRYLFQYAQDSDVREFDFTIGDEHYKRRFTNRIKDNFALHIDRYPARPASLVSRLVRRVQDKVRQNPELKTALKRHAWLLKDASSRVGRVFSSPNRLKRCISGIRSAFRTAVWSRDEVLFYSKPPQLAGETARGEVLTASLNDITRLSLEYPGFLNEARLRESRIRLKQGELLFIGRARNNEVATIWAEKRCEIPVPEIGRQCTVPLGLQVFVIYEIRTSPEFPLGDALSHILRAIAKVVAAEELWIYCSRRSQSLLRAIEEAGFQPRLRLSHRSLLHWFRRSSIAPLMKGDGPWLDTKLTRASSSRMQVPSEEDSVNHGSL